jgi:hypothetical protein
MCINLRGADSDVSKKSTLSFLKVSRRDDDCDSPKGVLSSSQDCRFSTGSGLLSLGGCGLLELGGGLIIPDCRCVGALF